MRSEYNLYRSCFFFNDTSTTEIYTYGHTLSLHDALPIYLKKGDMANEAERLLEDASWLPEPMRTPELLDAPADDPAAEIDAAELPAFLDDEVQPVDVDDDDGEAVAAAA